MKTLLLVASHSGFDLTRTGLGGPAALSDCLIEACRTRPDLKTSVLSSSLLGSGAPESGDFLGYKPSQFIAFFKSFNRAVAQEILRYDPREVVILSNDSLSFRTLSEKGYSIYCLHHMNYVDFFANVFLRDVLKSETLAGIHKLLMNSSARVLVPEAIDLIFRYQEESVVNVRGAIVPSAGLKRRFLQLYPKHPVNQIHVVPWGSLREAVDDGLVADRMFQLREEYRISCNTFVVLMVSRISPEKGQDRVIRALKIWENDPTFPTSDICLLICGMAGYRKAIPFEKRLRRFANSLRKIRVIFPGYVHGIEKQAHFRLADLYVFPSRYESYGLTLMEAFRSGLPAVACYTDGTAQMVTDLVGELLPDSPEREIPGRLKEAIERAFRSRDQLRRKGLYAKSLAEANPFSKAADYIIDLCVRGRDGGC